MMPYETQRSLERESHRRLRTGSGRNGLPIAIWLILALVGFVLRSSAGVGPTSAGEQTVEDFAGRLDERIGELMDRYEIPGVALALVRKGELVWSEAYGYADIETGRSMTVETVNRAESISKSVTAWGVMTLVDSGRLGLDDPIVDYVDEQVLGETRFPVDAVTVRQLLSHSAGVSLGTIGLEYRPDGPRPSLEDSLAEQFQLVNQPGSGFLYSNTGFNVLELLIEEVTGEDFAAYMQREVLDPLGMNDSSFAWRDDLASAVPVGYDLAGSPVPAYVYAEKASGGLFATVEDIARFVTAGMKGPYATDHGVLESVTIDRIYTPEVEITGLFRFVSPSYGLGHFLETLSNGEQAVWHGGQGHGWMTDFHAVPATGDGIVIMANSQRSWPLIAQVLSDWSQWNGFSPVGFAIIARATTVLWVVIAVVSVGSFLQLSRLGSGLARRRRRIAPMSQHHRIWRSVEALVSATLFSAVIWNSAQDYSFLSSAFPRASGWLGAATFGLAVVFLLSALTPRIASDGRTTTSEATS